MAISPINNSIGNTNYYGQISSGKRINSAADDAAGLTIANKLESQTKGTDAGTSNAKDGVGVLNIADGALGQINDSLQRIYELGVKASSPLNSSQELKAIQGEIGGLMKGIEDIAKGTEYNTMKLLDGSMADMDLATNPDGTGMSIKMANSTLESLGIDGFDVTGDFDLDRITDAISKVSESRSQMGATSNALEYTINRNNITAENLTGSQSKIEDLDIYDAISKLQKENVLNDYQMMMQRKKQEEEQQKTLGILQF